MSQKEKFHHSDDLKGKGIKSLSPSNLKCKICLYINNLP